MKLNIFQLETQLSKNLHSIYLVSGDEWILKQDAIHRICDAAHHRDYSEQLRLRQENDDIDVLYGMLYTNSLLASKKLLHVAFGENLPSKQVANLLGDYSNKPDANTVLILETPKIDSKTTRAAWYQTLEKNAVIVQIWPLTPELLPQWIKRRATHHNLKLDEEAVSLIIDYSEGNLSATSQLLEKLSLYQSAQLINAEIIKDFFKDESKFNLFDLGDGLVSKDKPRLIKILNYLSEERIEPTLVLWSLIRELRMLTQMALEFHAENKNFISLCSKYRIFPRRQNLVKKFLQSTSFENCSNLLMRATEIDKFIKGGAQGDVWQMLQGLVLIM